MKETREDQIISFYSRIHALLFIHGGLFSCWIYLGPEATRTERVHYPLKITYGLVATSMMSHSLQGNLTRARTIGTVIFLNEIHELQISINLARSYQITEVIELNK